MHRHGWTVKSQMNCNSYSYVGNGDLNIWNNHREANRAVPGSHLAPLLFGYSIRWLCPHGQLNPLLDSGKYLKEWCIHV